MKLHPHDELPPQLLALKARALKAQEQQSAVPDGYFARLEDNIMARIQAEEAFAEWRTPTPAARPSLWARWRGWALAPLGGLSLAASCAFLLGVGYHFWQSSAATPSGASALAITSEEAAWYVEQHIDEFGVSAMETTFGESLLEADWSASLDVPDAAWDSYLEEDLIDDVDADLLESYL